MIVFPCSDYSSVAIDSTSSTLDFSKLNNLIASRRLTESLELLEQCGFCGDGALYVIEFTQLEGEA